MVGRPSPPSPSISRLTSQPETIPSCYRRSRLTEFQPHPGRHPIHCRSTEKRVDCFVALLLAMTISGSYFARPHTEDRPMQYRNLGRSGLKISPICLGTMMFGGPTDEATSARIVAKAREAGINFIDTADAYNGGNSEQVVGRALSNNRHNLVLATKLANPMGDDPNRGGLSRRWVLQAADESLKRLRTDYCHIYYLTNEDHSPPLAETVRAMGELIQAGKVRYFGGSNYRAWRVAEICNIC